MVDPIADTDPAPPAFVDGIDASGWSGHLDYEKIAQELGFVYLQATDGVGTVDNSLLARANALRAAGMSDRIGVYHFLEVRIDRAQDAEEQCKEFLEARAKAGTPLVPWLDVELRSLPKAAQIILEQRALVTPSDPDVMKIRAAVRAAVDGFVDAWARLLGQTLCGYSSPGEMALLGLAEVDSFTALPLALAEYALPPGQAPATPPTSPKLPAPYTSWAFHQYAGNVAAYGGEVDRVRFNGTLTDLLAID